MDGGARVLRLLVFCLLLFGLCCLIVVEFVLCVFVCFVLVLGFMCCLCVCCCLWVACNACCGYVLLVCL